MMALSTKPGIARIPASAAEAARRLSEQYEAGLRAAARDYDAPGLLETANAASRAAQRFAEIQADSDA
jgi:hypothetical protein